MSEYIPLEIQAEILKRLPLKPLLQLRTVSKSFKCLIDSPNFIKFYYVHHPQTDDRFILRYSTPWLTNSPPHDIYKYITFVDDDNDDDDDNDNDDDYDYDFIEQEFRTIVPDLIKTFEPKSVSVVGSSHGLLCFRGSYKYPNAHLSSNYDQTEMVVLWNPSIRKSVGIRVPYMYDSPNEKFYNLDDRYLRDGVHDAFGFAVYPVTFDPVIIKIITTAYRWKRDGINAPWKVRIFTLSTGTWSILSTNLPRDSIRLGRDQVVIDGFIYWAAEDMVDADAEGVVSQPRNLIVSFDLAAREFKEISLTGSLTNRHCWIATISKLRESLVLLEYHGEFEKGTPVGCLWMMKEQGVSRSFTKLYTIKVEDSKIRRILGFRKRGELILEAQETYERFGEVEIYKWNSGYADGYADYLGIDEGEEYSFCMCPYMETLLLLDKSDGYIY